ncbi:deaminase, partial [Streptomyces resistomycificus]
MRLALEEAGRAGRGGDVPVGAVVLSGDGRTVLATGHNEREATGDPTAHAEVLAIR